MTERDRRALRIGGVTIVVALLLLRIVPWGARRIVRAERELQERATLLAHVRSEVTGAAALGDSAAELTSRVGRLTARLLSGDNPAEAQADLAAHLSLTASEHRVKVAQVDPLRDSTSAGRLRRCSMHAVIESDVRGLAGMLRALASGSTALSVRQLRIQAADPSGGGRGPEVLRGEVTVAGWYLGKRDAPRETD